MSGPLEGVRIVDLTTMISGPWAIMILADQGADVIKVETPAGGDHTRALGNQSGGLSAMFLNVNRNKRSVTVNLKSPRGVELVKDLAGTADVFVQNFRPGVVDRLGVGEPDIRAVSPTVVYVSISGFGEKGPYVGKPVYDPVIQALSGLASVQAGSDEEHPRLVRTILPDKLAAVTAAQAITSAIYAREKSGQGQHVRLSMLDAVLAFLWASDMGGQTYVDQPVSNQAAASFIDLIYETKDGHMTVAVMNDKEWHGLTLALDKPEWLHDPRFATPALRDQHIDERLEMTQEALRNRTTADWTERLERETVPCAPALTRNEVIEHAQVLASESLVEHDHPIAGRLRQVRPPGRFEATPTRYRRGAPVLGEHTDEVLRELGLSRSEIERLREDGAVGSDGRPDAGTTRTLGSGGRR